MEARQELREFLATRGTDLTPKEAGVFLHVARHTGPPPVFRLLTMRKIYEETGIDRETVKRSLKTLYEKHGLVRPFVPEQRTTHPFWLLSERGAHLFFLFRHPVERERADALRAATEQVRREFISLLLSDPEKLLADLPVGTEGPPRDGRRTEARRFLLRVALPTTEALRQAFVAVESHRYHEALGRVRLLNTALENVARFRTPELAAMLSSCKKDTDRIESSLKAYIEETEDDTCVKEFRVAVAEAMKQYAKSASFFQGTRPILGYASDIYAIYEGDVGAFFLDVERAGASALEIGNPWLANFWRQHGGRLSSKLRLRGDESESKVMLAPQSLLVGILQAMFLMDIHFLLVRKSHGESFDRSLRPELSTSSSRPAEDSERGR